MVDGVEADVYVSDSSSGYGKPGGTVSPGTTHLEYVVSGGVIVRSSMTQNVVGGWNGVRTETLRSHDTVVIADALFSTTDLTLVVTFDGHTITYVGPDGG
jgi:hypothetical protein